MPTALVEIPVLPHVKNLLISIYGPEPIKATENNLPGKELQFIFMQGNKKEKIIGEKISIRISQRLAPYYYKFNNAFSFGCYFEKQFNVQLFTHVEALKSQGIEVTTAIKMFLKKYNIDEEFFDLHRAVEIYRRMKYNKRISEQ